MSDINKLKSILGEMGSVAVAFSGGVDSSFLLTVAATLPDTEVIAITADSKGFPSGELFEAKSFCESLGVKHIVFQSNELKIKEYRENHPQRCYYCKRTLFKEMLRITKDYGMRYLIDGTNADDAGDYRPGLKAIKELGIRSPLKEAGLSKSDVRKYSREMGIRIWDKPSFSCLATRFPYGEKISEKKLQMVEEAEAHLKDLGFTQVRVRMHGNIARIEVLEDKVGELFDKRQQIVTALKKKGFSYVTADLEGYRYGSMDDNIIKNDLNRLLKT